MFEQGQNYMATAKHQRPAQIKRASRLHHARMCLRDDRGGDEQHYIQKAGDRSCTPREAKVERRQSAADIAVKLEMHVNSVYRAKDEVMRQLRTRLATMRDED